jgi:hypothetical protein
MMNNLVNNPATAAGAGAANMFSMGIPEAVAPEQYAALRDAQGPFVGIGEAGGAIAGTMALGGIGRGLTSRFAPALGQRIAAADPSGFARNAAVDTLYGAGYGGVTQGDPATGAALGFGASVAGQGGARALGATVGGINTSEAAQALRARGVPISVARQTGLGRVEDAMQSIPLVGDMSRARQLESFEGFNRAGMEEAGRPIGFQPTQIGAMGVADLGDAVSDAYTAATRNVTAPIDTQFYRDLRPVIQAVRGLPDDYRNAAETIIERRIEPAIQRGQISGEQFQQAIRGLRQARANAGKAPGLAGFEQEYRDALTGIEDLLAGTVTRGAGDQVAANLNAANAANRGLKTIENAALDAAKVGTQTGAPNVYTPAQLIGAARAAERRGYGQNPLMPLARQGQEVLPSTLPNSGTTDRAILTSGLGALGLGGIGALGGAASSERPLTGATEGATGTVATGAGILGALAALGTRRGQAALERVLITRPQAAQAFGQGIRRRSGIFGAAALPTFVQMSQPEPIYIPQ